MLVLCQMHVFASLVFMLHARLAERKWYRHMWPSATKWGPLRVVSKLRKVPHCNKHYFLHIVMHKWLLSGIFLSKVMRCWTLPCMISFQTAVQRIGLSNIVIYVYFYGPIKKKMFHNASFLPNFHWKKCLSWLRLIWWIFWKNISKMKNFDLGSYFCL